MYYYTLIMGKILKKSWHKKCFHIVNFFVNKFRCVIFLDFHFHFVKKSLTS